MEKMKYPEAEELLESYGVNVVEAHHAKSVEEAVSKSIEIGLPVVMKVESPDIIHKSDSGYVKTGLDTKEEVKEAYRSMKSSAEAEEVDFQGVVLQDQVQGKEVIVGGKKDPQFGPIILFGLGGIFVEVFKDTSIRIAPIDKEEAREMTEEIKAYPLLTGIRGEEKVNLEEIAETLVSVGKLMLENPEIIEMDLNPIIVNPDTAKAVDLRILVEGGSG